MAMFMAGLAATVLMSGLAIIAFDQANTTVAQRDAVYTVANPPSAPLNRPSNR